MRKNGIPEVLVRSVMSLYEGATMRVNVDFKLSKEFEVNVGIHQGTVMYKFPLAAVVDGALNVFLYADDLVMSEKMEALRNTFMK